MQNSRTAQHQLQTFKHTHTHSHSMMDWITQITSQFKALSVDYTTTQHAEEFDEF